MTFSTPKLVRGNEERMKGEGENTHKSNFHGRGCVELLCCLGMCTGAQNLVASLSLIDLVFEDVG